MAIVLDDDYDLLIVKLLVMTHVDADNEADQLALPNMECTEQWQHWERHIGSAEKLPGLDLLDAPGATHRAFLQLKRRCRCTNRWSILEYMGTGGTDSPSCSSLVTRTLQCFLECQCDGLVRTESDLAVY